MEGPKNWHCSLFSLGILVIAGVKRDDRLSEAMHGDEVSMVSDVRCCQHPMIKHCSTAELFLFVLAIAVHALGESYMHTESNTARLFGKCNAEMRCLTYTPEAQVCIRSIVTVSYGCPSLPSILTTQHSAVSNIYNSQPPHCFSTHGLLFLSAAHRSSICKIMYCFHVPKSTSPQGRAFKVVADGVLRVDEYDHSSTAKR